jgi:membrane protease YdiL (CAAX protease family)
MNMIGEELYYRGALQPKMRGVFGRWDWVANGILFALKHVYFWWRLHFIWPGGLAFAFIFGPMGSLPLSILAHWIGNQEPFILIGILSAVLGGG